MERFNIATDSKTDEKFTIVDGDTRISVFTDVFTGNRYAAGKYRVYRQTVEYRGEPVTVTLRGCKFFNGADYEESVVDLVSRYRMGNIRKQSIFSGALKSRTSKIFAAKRFRGPIEELRAVCGSDKGEGGSCLMGDK